MRLDKFLCDMNIGSRSQVKDILKKGLITVNGIVIKKPEHKINETLDLIQYNGTTVAYQKYFYYMLHKPKGYVSATVDPKEKTVMDLLSAENKRNDLFPAGRLDKDTEGFLLLTNDGELSHRLLTPKKHVDKTYEVTLEKKLSQSDIEALEHGLDIGEGVITQPASVEMIDDFHILLTIHEGKFHQVKRMLLAVQNKVVYLKRLSFGGLKLDEALKPGDYRILTEEEVKILYEA